MPRPYFNPTNLPTFGDEHNAEFTVEDVSDFLEKIWPIRADLEGHLATVYRGQGQLRQLRSKLVRYMRQEYAGDLRKVKNEEVLADNNEVDKLIRIEQSMVEQFQRQAIPYLAFNPENILEWLAVGQHHGLATRLLDWSENPLTSLFFAVENVHDHDKDGVVWAFTGSILSAAPKVHTLIDLDQYFEHLGTFIYYPKHINPRFTSQHGCFTVHKMNTSYYWLPLDIRSVTSDRNYSVTKFNIPAKIKGLLRFQLETMGINHLTLFPDLDGLSRKLNWGYFEKFGSAK